jgi:hypothetical protein
MNNADQLLVGYGKADITPLGPVPLGGYGNGLHRISTSVGDPIFATCANGAYGYIPSRIACEHGGYEADNTYYAPGCAERLAGMYLEMLNTLHGQK